MPITVALNSGYEGEKTFDYQVVCTTMTLVTGQAWLSCMAQEVRTLADWQGGLTIGRRAEEASG